MNSATPSRAALRPGCDRPRCQVVLIDGDDTLWPNNVYFERATDQYLDALTELHVDRRHARAHLVDVQRRQCPIFGYGSASYARNLLTCCADLLRSVPEGIETLVEVLAADLANHPVEPFDGVLETLSLLATRHRLVLVTKGDHHEQARKVALSGVEPYFEAVEIVREKTPAKYSDIVTSLSVAQAHTWMVGDSPLSDIHASLSAGLNAIFVRNPLTPLFERIEAFESSRQPHRVVLSVDRFDALQELL